MQIMNMPFPPLSLFSSLPRPIFHLYCKVSIAFYIDEEHFQQTFAKAPTTTMLDSRKAFTSMLKLFLIKVLWWALFMKPNLRFGLIKLGWLTGFFKPEGTSTPFYSYSFLILINWLVSLEFMKFFVIYHKVASSRPVYYSILNSFGQRSQYISIKFPLHKQSENPWMCY